jgi:hypothetical protein
MLQPRYPEAKWVHNAGPKGDGSGWGPLPDLARGASVDQIRLVFHTTETTGMPGYAGGRYAPHTSYDPVRREWTQHGEHHRRVGTLLGKSRTGVLGNEFSVQTEIICYSDKGLAAKVGGLWVGDFKDEHYADLADYVLWCRQNLFVPHLPLATAYGPADDFDSFSFGVDDEHEMGKLEWLASGGILTAHGAAPGQAHWDTGELDLHRIILESLLLSDSDPVPTRPSSDLLRQAESLIKTALLLIQEERRLS